MNATTYTETVAAGTYLYQVQAFNAAKVSAYSNQWQVRVKEIATTSPPGPPA